MVRVLLEYGASINAGFRGTGSSAIFMASQNNHPHVVRTLLDHGASVNSARHDISAVPITVAAENGVFLPQICYGYYLIAELLSTGNTAVVQLLINSGADVNHRLSTDQSTSLIWAAMRGHTEVVQCLIDGGADVNLARNDGATALVLAAQAGHEAIVRTLLDAGAHVGIARALQVAQMKNHQTIVKLLQTAIAQQEM